MAQYTHTPLTHYTAMPLREFRYWHSCVIAVQQENKQNQPGT